MPPLLFALLIAALAVAWLLILQRRGDLGRMARTAEERREARRSGTHSAALQHPQIDLSRCLGCGACIQACPEEGVLDMLHGQALVVHGANCIGHGHCEEACPVGAIRLAWINLPERRDLPALSPALEAPGRGGLFLAGEVTGRGLIRNAIEQGRAVAQTVDARLSETQNGARQGGPTRRDLVVVGAGPAGLSCALEAKQRGLKVVLLEQGPFGGTIAHFPREKLILTRALDLPGYGRLKAGDYGRDELLGVWNRAVQRSGLAIKEQTRYRGLKRDGAGDWTVQTDAGALSTRAVCLAIGRRGLPKRLGVPGEERRKVRYGLHAARDIRARRVLVIGGGDSAAETALCLCHESSNRVTLALRGQSLRRAGLRQRKGILAAEASGELRVLYESVVTSIEEECVILLRAGKERVRLANDDVFVMIGAAPSLLLLESSGISFDPRTRVEQQVAARLDSEHEERRRLLLNLGAALVLASALWAWALCSWDYYGLGRELRPLHTSHGQLKPSGSIGLAFGWFAMVLFVTNLAYLLRRIPLSGWSLPLPRHWLSLHITSGLLLLPIAMLHGGLQLGNTTGGHALGLLSLLVVTGAVGRFLYAYLPRAVDGRDLEYEGLRSELLAIQAELAGVDKPLAQRVQRIADELNAGVRWRSGTFTRVWGLLRSPARLRRASRKLEQEARALGLAESEVQHLKYLLTRAERTSRLAAHCDDLRAVLSGWRHVHLWIAALFSLLLLRHVWDAWKYGTLWPW